VGVFDAPVKELIILTENMLRNGTYQYNLPVDYHNIQQMAVAGDMMEDFVVIFRDMMGRVGFNSCQRF